MKNTILKYLIVTFIFFALSCEKGDVFTGSPVDSNLPVEQITGIITTKELNITAGQDYLIDVTIPFKFDTDVSVQAETFVPALNTRVRRSVVIPAGQLTKELKMTAPGRGNYILPYKLQAKVFLTSINTSSSEVPGGFKDKIYKITSNSIDLGYGDLRIADVSPNRLGITFDFEGPYLTSGNTTTINNLSLSLRRGGVITSVGSLGATTAPLYGSMTGSGRVKELNFNNTSTSLDGTYTLNAFANRLISTPRDMPYRVVVAFPNDKIKTYIGIIPNMIVGTAITATPILQIKRETRQVNGITVVDFEVTQLP